MSHYFFLSVPDYGHIFPSVAVAEELARRGHRVTYLTGDKLTDLVSGPGLTAVGYESAFETAPKMCNEGHQDGAEILMLTVDESAAWCGLRCATSTVTVLT